MIIVNCEQGTEEWFSARCGIPTASCFSQIITSKGEKSTSAKKYARKLAGESIAGVQESYKSSAMQRGNELEPEARKFFEFVEGLEVEEVGICYKDELKNVSCSPDGLIGDDCGLEIKCPNLETHVDYLLSGKLPTAYVAQVQGSMYVTGRSSWYFMSYFPKMKPFLIKVKRDAEFCAKLSKYLNEFNNELLIVKERLK